ncbi:hypothetical protein [Streptomyces sp. WG-D5]
MAELARERDAQPLPDYWYGLPHGYIQLDLSPSLQTVEELVAQVRSLEGEARKRAESVVQFYAGIVTLLNDQQVQGCAMGLLPGDDGDIVSSVLTVSTVEIPGVNPRLALADLMGGGPGKPEEGLRPMELPCGPGFLMERIRNAPAPGGTSAQKAEGPTDGEVWQGAVAVPAPSSQSIILLQLVTADLDMSDAHRDILRGVAHTLTFADPTSGHPAPQGKETRQDGTETPFG